MERGARKWFFESLVRVGSVRALYGLYGLGELPAISSERTPQRYEDDREHEHSAGRLNERVRSPRLAEPERVVESRAREASRPLEIANCGKMPQPRAARLRTGCTG